MDLDYLSEVIQAAKFKNLGTTLHPVTNEPYYEGWLDDIYDEYWSGPNKDFLGSQFAPFRHNYLYGWTVTEMITAAFRAMNEDEASQKMIYELFDDMDKKVGGHEVTPQYLRYVQEFGGHHLLLLVMCFQFSRIPFNESVYLMYLFFSIEAKKLVSYNANAMYMIPISIATQLYGLGWKRTLATWALGALVTEGLSVQIAKREPFSGWSLISFMIYGQMLNETFSDRKLRTVKGGLQSLRGLGINGLGGYGTYVTLSNLYYDPAPFLQKSQKTGIHHGVHHLALLGGFLMNRWSR